MATYGNRNINPAMRGRTQPSEVLSYSPQLGLKLALTQPAEALITQAPLQPSTATVLRQAQALNAEASELFHRGQAQEALLMWRDAQAKYAEAHDPRGVLGSQINQAQALQTIGLYNRARTLMETLRAELETQVDPDIQALGLQSLGSIFQATGYLADSQEALGKSLDIAQQYQLDSSATRMTLGNTLRALKQPEAALVQYHLAAATGDRLIRLEALLNQLSLHIDQQQWQLARSLLGIIHQQFQELPPSRRAIYARVNLASSLMQMLEQQGDLSLAVGTAKSVSLARLQVSNKAAEKSSLVV